jgi:hypothetical protein
MSNRLLVWAAGSPTLQRQVTENPIARRAADRFVAGEQLDEALAVAAKGLPCSVNDFHYAGDQQPLRERQSWRSARSSSWLTTWTAGS